MHWSQGQSTRLRFLGMGAVCSLIAITFLIFSTRYSAEIAKYALKGPVGQPPLTSRPTFWNDSSWEFEVKRDGNDHGLSEEQCRAAFPKLFVEIDKTASLREDNPIQFKDVDTLTVEDGMVRGIIEQGELYIVDFGAMPATFTRGKATLHSLQRALSSFPDRGRLPNIEFVLTTEDYSNGKGPIWSYSKRDEDSNVWLMPDFGYWSWPEVRIGPYKDVRRRIAAVDDGDITINGQVVPGLHFHDKKKQLAWRGSVATNPQVRGKLLKAAQGKSWASIRVIDWDDENDIRFNLLPMEEHCRYMFLAHTEGRSFSGRGKYLLNCRSVVISHKLVWREAHHAALISSGPEANYVEVERDFSDLDRKIEFLIDNPEAAERIANNAVETFRDRYLTPAAESCYWRHLIRQYASSSNFEPVLYSTQADGKKKSRGIPFETWVLTS
ncbi:glycosyl transferase family 90-domain-containing protein [Aspergillus alliaceus]|uniref:Glycosyl transferase family 90-domain-containing protein n=1 Tax=Petromyces alliaceus TaxID=209559 RepID=A0A5N7CKQ1_PETAA|nr:glycosyl transferase family 90-domain-containing protein [Aspergillus alliaceus]